MAENVGDLTTDLLTLGELQAELLRIDLKEAADKSVAPGVVAVLGTGLVLGCCPVALLGLAWWLESATELTLAASALIVAGAALVVGCGLLYAAYRWLRTSVATLGRSREEFRRNLRWVKSVLTRSRR
jgi:hypothetical protein